MTVFKVENNKVVINKEITELDRFVFELVNIIEKYCGYIIISGYVSIFFGRSRATEDVDMFIDNLSYESFNKLFCELLKKGYELNEDNQEHLYLDYLQKGTSINIWKKDFPLLRLEVKIAKKKSQKESLDNPIEVSINGKYRLFFPQIESQIAYKRYIAKSQKDIEDARHLEIVFSSIDKNKIKYYKNQFLEEFK
jgi:predicted nucleotidyltransferase